MKKYIYTLSIVISSVFFSSCEDELTKNPYNSLSEENVFSSPDGFSNAMRGVYAGFIDNGTDNLADYYGGDFFSVPDILTDNVIIKQNGRQSKKVLFDWLYSANNYGGFDFYGDAYKIIRKANAIINNIDNLPSGSFKNNILGEALTARALAHFDLVRVYAKIPTQSSDAGSSLGVAYVETVDANIKPKRNTVSEVYTKVINDLETAEKNIASDNGNGRFNKNVVNALLSRVHLYAGNWKKVVDYANEVSGTVATIDNFPKVWKDESSDGIVGQFLIRIIDGVAIGTEYSQTNGNTGAVRSEYVVSYDFYQMFKDNDVRKDAYISTSEFSDVTYNHIAKYFGKKGQVNNIVNAKIIRMAEVMLNKAEAYSELDNDIKALEALDAVRSQRYVGFTSDNETGEELKKAIALEKRLEFAFESHRFFDLKRKNLSINRSSVYGDVADGSGTPAVFKELKAGSHKFQLPIPQDAINSNKKNLKQNPGY